MLRRELVMGLALGLSLGVIALFRGAATDSDTRGGPEKAHETFVVKVPAADDLAREENGDYLLPAATPVTRGVEKPTAVRLPHDAAPDRKETPDGIEYTFPAGSELRTPPVGRWHLGAVIALSVFGICLWGTLIGASLPLVFRKFGLDPAIASGPFVATFVDITGIAIFFLVAKAILL